MKNLIPIFIRQKLSLEQKRGSMAAATMFVDISGFTKLTSTLMRQGTEGAEVLSEMLDTIFVPMVKEVTQQGGIIPHFAGDAFTAIFYQTDASIIDKLAHNIKNRFDDKSSIQTKFGTFDVSIRIGLSYGIVEWGVVGKFRQTFYFSGYPMTAAALVTAKTPPKSITIDENFKIWQIGAFKTAKTPPLSIKQNDSFLDKNFDLEAFLPKAVIDFNEKGEFREVVSIFINFSDLDNHEIVEAIADILLEKFDAFGGYFKELDFSEKGTLAVGFFGAPVAYENNIARALECALAIKTDLFELTPKYRNLHFQIGITAGMAYAGVIGSDERQQYAIVGNYVNLAARLMQQAAFGEILVDKNVVQVKNFDFTEKGNLHYKGFDEAIATYKLVRKRSDEKTIFFGEMFGRDTELRQLVDIAISALWREKGNIVYIWGEAGVGKSRLTFELRRELERNLQFYWASCQTDQILKKPFNPFIYFLRAYFKQEADRTNAENKRLFEQVFTKLVRSLPESAYTEGGELIRTQSVLAALLGINYTDSLWLQLDGKGRYENTLAAMTAFFRALAFSRPLIIEIEDIHWLDDDSAAFLKALVKRFSDLPILVLMTSRYDDNGEKNYVFDNTLLKEINIQPSEIDLNILSPDALKSYASNRLHGEIHDDLQELLWRITNGNPFYAEQILAYFLENNLLQLSDFQWTVKDKNIKISNSIQAILTARIDRLSLLVRETVKAAAVIGREFEVNVLNEVMHNHEEFQRQSNDASLTLREQIQTAERGQIWRAMNELRYIFRHALLREAVYDMQLRTRLRELHALIARAIEKVYADSLAERYLDLAFHYEQADILDKAHDFLKKAGDYARRNFQNQQALDCYDRILQTIQSDSETVRIQLRRGEVLQTIGRWHDAEIALHDALFKVAKSEDTILKGRTNNALGYLLMLKGNYDEARQYLEKAALLFEKNVDYQGITQVYGNLGNLFFRQGEYEQARNYFEQSIIIARENGLRSPAQIVSNLGLTHMNQGNYTEGVAVQREELTICANENDRLGQAILNVNLGIVFFEKGDEDNALKSFEQGLDLCLNLGNKQLTSIALGCLGNVWRLKGNFEKAESFLNQDFDMCNELGDRQGIAVANELLGRLELTRGDFERAYHYFEASNVLCQQIKYQKGIAKALQGLGEVFSFQNDFLKALTHFENAILIAKKINNQLILGQSLIEKGIVLLKGGDLVGARGCENMAREVAEKLGNDKLLESAKALGRKLG